MIIYSKVFICLNPVASKPYRCWNVIKVGSISLMLIRDKIDFTIRLAVTEIWKRPIKWNIIWNCIISLSCSCVWFSSEHISRQESQRGRDPCLFLRNYYCPCKVSVVLGESYNTPNVLGGSLGLRKPIQGIVITFSHWFWNLLTGEIG